MATEIEVKVSLKAGEKEQIQQRLIELGAQTVSPRTPESNRLFDFSDSRLRRTGCALRLRVYGETSLLTFKGPVREDPLYKVREEFQTDVDSPESLAEILGALGLTVIFEYSKVRQIMSLELDGEQILVCLDETPMGDFAELEGSPRSIDQLASTLGWSRDSFVRKNYVELYREHYSR